MHRPKAEWTLPRSRRWAARNVASQRTEQPIARLTLCLVDFLDLPIGQLVEQSTRGRSPRSSRLISFSSRPISSFISPTLLGVAVSLLPSALVPFHTKSRCCADLRVPFLLNKAASFRR